jgi:hypothetical protein
MVGSLFSTLFFKPLENYFKVLIITFGALFSSMAIYAFTLMIKYHRKQINELKAKYKSLKEKRND